jgi:ATP-dependent DNA helicase RecG
MSRVFEAETKMIEFKREYTRNILKTVSAFSNFHDGEIIIGIDNDFKIIGVDDPVQMKLNLENAINDNIIPRPYYEIHEEIIGGRTLIIVKVYSGENTPYLYDNKAYKRMDTSTIIVDRYDYEGLILKGRNQGYDELIFKGYDLEFEYLNKKLRDKLNLGIISKDILKTLGLIKNEKFTNAAALLSDNNPLNASGISLIRFEGNSVSNIKDRLMLKNISLLEVFDKSIEFYYKHINTSEIIKGAYRKTIEEVPFVAYREALSNCIVHRNYVIETDSRIEIYDDRIEVISPGGLPIGITEEEYIDGRISVPRNKIIADMFLRLGIIERLATGIRRIREYYKDYKVKPEFLIAQNTITVILPNIYIDDKRNERLNESMNEPMNELSKEEEIVVKYILENNSINRIQVENLLSLKKTFSVKILNGLIEKDIIKRIGRGKNTFYILANIRKG